MNRTSLSFCGRMTSSHTVNMVTLYGRCVFFQMQKCFFERFFLDMESFHSVMKRK